jgi:hypothetical protein
MFIGVVLLLQIAQRAHTAQCAALAAVSECAATQNAGNHTSI